MKKSRTVVSLALACLMALCLGLAACSGGSTGSGEGAAGASEEKSGTEGFPGRWKMIQSEDGSGIVLSEQAIKNGYVWDTMLFLELNEDGTGEWQYNTGDVVGLTWKPGSATSAKASLNAEILSIHSLDVDLALEDGVLVMSNGAAKLTFKRWDDQLAAEVSAKSASSEAAASEPEPTEEEFKEAQAALLGYTVSDQSFHEVYEANGKVYMDAVGEVVNVSQDTMVVDGFWIGAVNKEGKTLAQPTNLFLSPMYAKPGESLYVYPNGPIELPAGTTADDGSFASLDLSLAVTDKAVVEYPLSDVVMSDDNGHPGIGCKVTNNTQTSTGEVTVVVVYYDKGGKLIGVAEDTVANLDPGESATCAIPGDRVQHGCSYSKVGRYDIRATALV